MNTLQRIKEVLVGLVMIIMATVMLDNYERGFRLIAFILCVTMFALGVKYVVFYFRMARYMVEGRFTLYEGMILVDVGAFGLTLNDFPPMYLIMYLMAIHAFTGAVDLLNALEARKLETPWKAKLLHGLIDLYIAGSCFYSGFIAKDIESVVYLYALGLFASAVSRIVGAFRRTAIVYIQ